MCTSEEKKRLAYDKAIEGYQFQVGRYNTWMNYYSIFVGALFVALYSIWPATSNSGCCCCKCCNCHEAVSDPDTWVLPFVISILGFLASVCWYGALLGYRKWNGHWMKIVRACENSLNDPEKDLHPVYDEMPANDKGSCFPRRIWRAIKRCFICRKSEKRYYSAGYISTQKITGIFIVFIMLAWIAAFAFAIYKYNNDCCAGNWALGTGVVFMIVLLCCLHYGHCCFFSSEIIKKE